MLAKALKEALAAGDEHEPQVRAIVSYAMERGGVTTKESFKDWLEQQLFLLQRNEPKRNPKAKWPETPKIERLAKLLSSHEGLRATLKIAR